MPKCKACDASIVWATTDRGSRIPYNAEPGPKAWVFYGSPADPKVKHVQTRTPHWASCPEADTFRKSK